METQEVKGQEDSLSIIKEVIDFTNYTDTCHMYGAAGVARMSMKDGFAHLKVLAPYEDIEMEEDDTGRSLRVQCLKRPDGRTVMYTVSGRPDDVSTMYYALREVDEGTKRMSMFLPRLEA